jgi:hypothetical protein
VYQYDVASVSHAPPPPPSDNDIEVDHSQLPDAPPPPAASSEYDFDDRDTLTATSEDYQYDDTLELSDSDSDSDDDDEIESSRSMLPPPSNPPVASTAGSGHVYDSLYPMRMLGKLQAQTKRVDDNVPLHVSAPELGAAPSTPPPLVSRASKPQLLDRTSAGGAPPPINRASKPPSYFQNLGQSLDSMAAIDAASDSNPSTPERPVLAYDEYAGVGQSYASTYGCSYGMNGSPSNMYQQIPSELDEDDALPSNPENAPPIYRYDSNYPPIESVLSILRFPPELAVALPLCWLFEIVKVLESHARTHQITQQSQI